jgi:hypothetical protein
MGGFGNDEQDAQQEPKGPIGARRARSRGAAAGVGPRQRRSPRLCPVQYGWQRASHAHTVLSILRVVRNTYFPHYRISDVIENIYVALPVFIAHVAGKPCSASQVARALEMPRNTAVRKLDWLIREGYVMRHGTKYCMTDKINVTGLEQVLRMHARLCETSARNLSILDIAS